MVAHDSVRVEFESTTTLSDPQPGLQLGREFKFTTPRSVRPRRGAPALESPVARLKYHTSFAGLEERLPAVEHSKNRLLDHAPPPCQEPCRWELNMSAIRVHMQY
jgi:hypothetical protein